MDQKIAKKYNINVPRYTSYPAVPFWKGNSQEAWEKQLKKCFDENKGIDLYIHVPFCEKLCYYCGCHRVITKEKDRGREYVDYLVKEWDYYKRILGTVPEINSIHFGGGTPNFLSVSSLDYLFGNLEASFSQVDFQGAVEIDPRTITKEQLEIFSRFGINRISMGIQDFDPEVQKAIGRIQSYEKVASVVEHCREVGIRDINFDLIYGLPKQNIESIIATIEKVKTLSPKQIAFYSYAHLPSKIKNQRAINSNDVPEGQEKRLLYETGKKLLLKAGYGEVGLDHFAKRESSLYKAKIDGTLHRNFMGHTIKHSPIIIGLGVSAISSTQLSFSQNTKSISDYYRSLEQSKLPITNGHIHNQTDKKIEQLIQQVFSKGEIKQKAIEALPNSKLIQLKLDQLLQDGLVNKENGLIKITKLGLPFTRVIAASLDEYFCKKQGAGGSKAL